MYDFHSPQMQEFIGNLKDIVETFKEQTNGHNEYFDLLNVFGLADQYDSFDELIDIELQRYWLYLMASDGLIDDSEVALFNAVFDLDFTADGCKKIIIECDIYSEEFEERYPFSLCAAAYAEEWVWQNRGKRIDLTNPLINCYDAFGSSILEIDGDIDSSEIADHESYINTLRNFVPDLKVAMRAQF